MVGEILCIIAYVMYWACGGLKHDTDDTEDGDKKEDPGKPNMFLFLPPALCDVTATSMMYIGLTMTPASQFQMLRGGTAGLLILVQAAFVYHTWSGLQA